MTIQPARTRANYESSAAVRGSTEATLTAAKQPWYIHVPSWQQTRLNLVQFTLPHVQPPSIQSCITHMHRDPEDMPRSLVPLVVPVLLAIAAARLLAALFPAL